MTELSPTARREVRRLPPLHRAVLAGQRSDRAVHGLRRHRHQGEAVQALFPGRVE